MTRNEFTIALLSVWLCGMLMGAFLFSKWGPNLTFWAADMKVISCGTKMGLHHFEATLDGKYIIPVCADGRARVFLRQ